MDVFEDLSADSAKEDLLLLVHRMPYPPNKGDKVCSYHLLRHLSQRYRVHLATFIDDADDWQHADTVRAWCGETHFAKLDPRWARLRSLRGLLSGQALTLSYYFDRGLAQWVDALCKRRSIRHAVVFSSPMAQYVNARDSLERVIDFVDIDSLKWTQYGNGKEGATTGLGHVLKAPLRWLYRREGKKLLAFERETSVRAKVGAFVTRAETALFQKLAPESADKIITIENGVDSAYFSPGHAFASPYQTLFAKATRVIVFTGAMDYLPNVDAVQWFARDILPLVRQQHLDVSFCIVGARPTAEVLALAQIDGVSVTGTVADVRPYVAHAALAVVPMRIARGIQNKALEAMAMARPVVITAASAVALNATPQCDFCVVGNVADTVPNAAAFANAVNALLSHPDAAENMGVAARAAVLENYSWEKNLGRIDDYLQVPQVVA